MTSWQIKVWLTLAEQYNKNEALCFNYENINQTRYLQNTIIETKQGFTQNIKHCLIFIPNYALYPLLVAT